MDNSYAIYQLQIQMWDLLLMDWKANLITTKYWGVMAFIILYYAIWWKLTDKRRLSELLLVGSLFAVIGMITDLAGVTAGLWLYKVRILPLPTSIFLYNLTIAPLTFMLAVQYSKNWRQFFLCAATASGLVHFILLPFFSKIGVFQIINWNLIYGFSLGFAAEVFARAAFHFIKQVQYKAVQGYDSPFQSTLMHPAFKRFDDDKE